MGTPRAKILCVDDETSVLEALKRLLRNDFEVITATCGEDGLKLLENHQDVAIVLSDFRMEGMSGAQFLHRCREMVPNAIRAILSGQIDLKQISEAINRAEIHRLILKPWDNDYLVIQMKEALLSHGVRLEKDRLLQLAITDPVTGLTNHRYFQEKLQELWKRDPSTEHPLSLLMIDIDNFKSVNDDFGHLAGDHVLAQVADRLRHLTKERESISRYGGEEFSLILPDTDLTSARQRADQIRHCIAEQPFTVPDSPPIALTVSVGVAVYPHQVKADRPTQLISWADQALYRAKHQGRNLVVVSDPTLDRN